VFNNCWALVVEADAHSLIAISALLRDLGIHFKRNTTGSAVADQALLMQPRPAFILLDLALPHGDAFQILSVLKTQPALNTIPVIAIADDSALGLAPRTRHAGFSGFLPKPLPRRNLGEVLNRILNGEQVWQTPSHPASLRQPPFSQLNA
jgi:CheY-like chemotaxis protein